MATTSQTGAVVALLKDLVRERSLSYEEEGAADLLERYVRERDLPVGRHAENVYFWLGDGDRTLLLNSHLDVVPPSENHPHDPFDPVEEDGVIWGRGTVDAKASGAAMTRALVELAEEGWTPDGGRLLVALTACEETGGDYNGLEDLRPQLPELESAIVGEPTELQPCIGQKGLLILKLHARGKSVHAARSERGTNPIYGAARDLRRLESFAFERDDPFLGRPSLTPTVIRGGEARNMVPDRCTVTLDIRSTPAYTHEEMIETIDEAVEADVEVHSKRLIPTSTEPDARIVRACLEALPGTEPFGSPTTSDWIFLNDVPTVKLGPGPSERSHTAEERIEIDELARGVAAYKKIARTYFSESLAESR